MIQQTLTKGAPITHATGEMCRPHRCPRSPAGRTFPEPVSPSASLAAGITSLSSNPVGGVENVDGFYGFPPFAGSLVFSDKLRILCRNFVRQNYYCFVMLVFSQDEKGYLFSSIFRRKNSPKIKIRLKKIDTRECWKFLWLLKKNRLPIIIAMPEHADLSPPLLPPEVCSQLKYAILAPWFSLNCSWEGITWAAFSRPPSFQKIF